MNSVSLARIGLTYLENAVLDVLTGRSQERVGPIGEALDLRGWHGNQIVSTLLDRLQESGCVQRSGSKYTGYWCLTPRERQLRCGAQHYE